MPLSIGHRIGPYEILSLIGKGGMGEVYRARDAKLKRDVALKILPAAFARDPERLTRFQREAEVLASLNHTNIAAIYGIEQDTLVMELVEGESPKGPMTFDDAWKIGSQIAAALEYAHDRGIVHRDLKPANVKVAPDGTVKLLDFGLAKAFTGQKDTPPGSNENSPTLTIGATEVGVILGTAAYMSPEQARGKPVDKRADIWAFGVLMYELLSGRRPFKGDDVSEILASVIKDEPDWKRVPDKAQRLLRSCLEKDPKRRLRDIGDGWRLLEDPQAVIPSPSRLGWMAGALTVALLAVLAFLWPKPAALHPLVRLDVDLGPSVSLGSLAGSDTIISPDGSRLVFVSKGRLFSRRLDQPTAAELPGTEDAFAPFFSPDSEWVAFFTPGKLKKISVEGGAVVVLCDAPLGRGGSWGEDHSIIAALSASTGLSRVPDVGGTPKPLTELAPGEATHRWPQILPGGKVLFTANRFAGTGFESANIEVISGQDHARRTLQVSGTYGRYLPTSSGALFKNVGHLLYVSNGTLFAVPFDLDALALRGTPVPVLDQVSYSGTNGHAQFDFSQTGIFVYRTGPALTGSATLQWLNGRSKSQPLPLKPGPYNAPRVSPDGKLVALSVSSGARFDIWTYDWQRDAILGLTFGDGHFTFPVWTPDGRYIIFHGDAGILWTRADGGGESRLLIQSKYGQFPWSFSPDGKRLAYAEQSQHNQLDIWTVAVENDGGQLRAGKPEVFLQTPANELYPAFSPDGRWIAYRSEESGNYEIYVRAFPDNGGKWLISNNGGVVPVWSRNEHELFYRTLDQRIMVVAFTTPGGSFLPGRPQLWSEKRLAETGNYQNFDTTPDGKSLAVLIPAEEPEEQKAQNQVVFLLSFFDELCRRVPVHK